MISLSFCQECIYYLFITYLTYYIHNCDLSLTYNFFFLEELFNDIINSFYVCHLFLLFCNAHSYGIERSRFLIFMMIYMQGNILLTNIFCVEKSGI